MKWFLIFLTSFFAQLSVGQTYVPFISTADSSDQWMDYQPCSYNGGGGCLEHYLTAYSVNGDTTINGENYAQISAVEKHWLTEGIFGNGTCPANVDYSSFFAGGIREDNMQVFFYDPVGNSEYLMYDFNLTIGDTVPDPSGYNFSPEYHIIDSIDSILIDNSYRKRYILPEINGVPTHIIEGIGASTGLLYFISSSLSCYSELSCYKENGMTIYPEGTFCDMNLGVLEDRLYMEISPNPASDILTIQSDVGSTMEVEILNSFGQVVLKESLSELMNEMDVSQLSSGIYFVKILVEGKVGVQKVVIE